MRFFLSNVIFALILISVTVFTLLPSLSFAEGKWISRSAGVGMAPDRMFAIGEYGWLKGPWLKTALVAVTPSLTNMSAALAFVPLPFLEFDIFGGRSLYYRTWKGSGWMPVPNPETFKVSDLNTIDGGRTVGVWIAGSSIRFYWSTLKHFKNVFEGMLKYSIKWQWMDRTLSGGDFYDPVASGLVGRSDRIHDFLFVGSWRVNPEEKHATRLGIMSDTETIQNRSMRQVRVGPIFQSQKQNSPWEYLIHIPVRLEDPADPRSVGFFFRVSYKDE